jgi:hypothetical protein
LHASGGPPLPEVRKAHYPLSCGAERGSYALERGCERGAKMARANSHGGGEGSPAGADGDDEARRFDEAILATMRQPLLVLTGDLHVEIANPAFFRTFEVDQAETRGRPGGVFRTEGLRVMAWFPTA